MGNVTEFAFVPKCTPQPVSRVKKPWFVVGAMAYSAKDARKAFVKLCYGDKPEPDAWEALKIEGWRIVKVRVTEQLR